MDIRSITSKPSTALRGLTAMAHLVNADESTITIDFGNEIKQYRNHSAERLLESVGIGGMVKVCKEYVILRFPIDHY